MKLSMFKSRPFYLLFVFAGLGFLAWIAGETHFTFAKPDESVRNTLIEQALAGAQITFSSKEEELIRDTERLANSIRPVLEQGEKKRIYNRISNQDGFWGITLFRNRNHHIWTGNPVPMLPDASSDQLFVTLSRSGQVLFFVCQLTIYSEDGTRFDLVTTRIIRRSGASPVLLTDQIDITKNWSRKQVFPVNFRFFDLDPTPAPARKIALNTVSVDSVGYATASIADFPALEREWHRNMVYFRYSMLTFGSLILLLLFSLLILKSNTRHRSILFAFLFAISWLALRQVGIPFPRLILDTASSDTTWISLFTFDATFASLTLFSLASMIYHKESTASPSIKWLALAPLGFISGAAGIWIVQRTHEVIMNVESGLLALSIAPDFKSWIIYITVFLLFLSFLALIYSLLKMSKNEDAASVPKISGLILAGFIAGCFVMFQFTSNEVQVGVWFTLLTILLLIAILMRIQKPGWLGSALLPAPRLIAITVFAVVFLSIPVFFDAKIEKENQEMFRMAINYSETNEDKAKEISRVLLRNLAEDSGIQQIQTIDAFPTFPIHAAAQFRRRVNQLVEPEWNSYTILAFLLDGRLNVITDFGSQPAFSDRFSSSFYEEVRYFIRQSLQKPFARLPIVESDPRFKGFPVFVKGLQSIPSDFPSQPSWLVTFVLVEGTTFGRPIHDALVFHKRDRENWNRYVLTEYVDGIKTRTTAAARTPIYPVHLTLDADIMMSDEAVSIRRIRDGANVRQLIYRHDDQTTVIATVRDKTTLNYIFSGFRYFVAMLILALVFYNLSKFSGFASKAKKTEQGQRLHDRILDSYLLATLLFLVALAFVTEFIVSRQNLTIAEQELSRNLTLLENRIHQMEVGSTDFGGLDPQDIDIIIYDSGRLAGTTAPEIFRLQLLSEFMPFEAYDKIHRLNASTVFTEAKIGSLPVLMGFRALFEDGKVRRVIAIPAYTRSAAYEEEFLQTTSYLIAFYIIIFVFFTGGAWVLSRKLTKPLSEFQSGLKKISSGNLDTMIPVTSNDEIGELADAYNQMVKDLKKVREELALAERDAAWSEMARQIAHEIKNPLTPMKLNIQHLQRQVANGNKSVEDLKPLIERISGTLINQIESLSTISSDFSKFAKPVTGVYEKTDLRRIVTQVISLFDNYEQLTIRFEPFEEPVMVVVIADEINRVLINLIKNSIEASENHAEVDILLERNSDSVSLFITDKGSGISAENSEKIFTPNFSTKTSGTGLGLAICKKIMEAHKGSIHFSSSNGNGTTFRLNLPLADNKTG